MIKKNMNYLLEQYDKNLEKINLMDTRIKLLQSNSIENKSSKMLIIFELSYFILNIINILFMNNISNIVPVILNVIPFGVSIASIKLMNKKNKYSDKTNVERIVSEKLDLIELEKVENRNKVIENLLEKNEVIDESKDTNLKYNIKELRRTLINEYRELDTLTTKYILAKEIATNSCNFKKIISFIGALCGGALFLELFSLLPLYFISRVIPVSVSSFFIPSIVGAVSASGYYIKKTSNQVKALNGLKHKLGENLILPKNNIYKELEQLRDSIDKKIANISNQEVEIYQIENTYKKLNQEQIRNVICNGKTRIQPRGPIIKTNGKRKVLAPFIENKDYYF